MRIKLAVLLLTGATIACGTSDTSDGDPLPGQFPGPAQLPTCGTTTGVFSVSPVEFRDLLGWVPLGQLNPPGHLFPTDHQYLYINNPENQSTWRQVQVFAPGNITITRAHRTHYSVSNTYDYALEFSPCAEVFANFGHVTSITPALLAHMGAFDQECGSYSLGTGAVFSNCFTKLLAIEVGAGDLIGTSGGQGTSFALDFGLHDNRAPPIVFANSSRWLANQNGHDIYHTVAASAYFIEPVRSTIRTHLGSFNGAIRRTVEPLDGTIAHDVPGTAQGIWINPSQPTYPEGPHLAIAPDAVDAARFAFSMGTSQPFFNAGLYYFTPASGGFVNRHPAQVSPGAIYCYEFTASLGVILIRLEDATTLKVEGRAGPATCAAHSPFAFTGSAFSYNR